MRYQLEENPDSAERYPTVKGIVHFGTGVHPSELMAQLQQAGSAQACTERLKEIVIRTEVRDLDVYSAFSLSYGRNVICSRNFVHAVEELKCGFSWEYLATHHHELDIGVLHLVDDSSAFVDYTASEFVVMSRPESKVLRRVTFSDAVEYNSFVLEHRMNRNEILTGARIKLVRNLPDVLFMPLVTNNWLANDKVRQVFAKRSIRGLLFENAPTVLC